MYEDDVGYSAIPALLDLSHFTPLPDRLQQGFLDFIYLGRLLANPDGLAKDPAFKFGGQSALATDKGLFYYGNSQGGIAGGALTAVEPDITRTVLYVPGMNYSTLLTRSVDFADYATILYPAYPDQGARPLLLSLIQSMWDRGEPDGYANHMTTDPLPNTPAHKVLIQMAWGDHQVANVQTEVEARTIGAPLRRPALDANRLADPFDEIGVNSPFYGMGTLGDPGGPAGGRQRHVHLGHRTETGGPAQPRPDTRDPSGADHQHGAGRQLRGRSARHRDRYDPDRPGPDRRVPEDGREDHRPLREQPLLRGGLGGSGVLSPRTWGGAGVLCQPVRPNRSRSSPGRARDSACG